MRAALGRPPSADLVLGGGLLTFVFLMAALGPFVWTLDPIRGILTATFRPPLTHIDDTFHPLGTDQLGRDLLARIIEGTRISLSIVIAAELISVTLGTLLGMIAGYFGRAVDTVIMRLVDIQLAVPFILLILLVVAIVGPSYLNLILVLGITGWAVFARVARARTLEVRELEYIDAAAALGLPTRTILLRHVLPNILVPQIVLLTLDLPRLIVLEASIGFLGLGVQPPTPTLGNLIGEGRSYILVADWLILYPGLVIAALVIAFNLLGDWLIKKTNVRVG
jgi:peptide/nickel transport system permease protein